MNFNKKLTLIGIGTIAALGLATSSISTADAHGFQHGNRWMHQNQSQNWQHGPQHEGRWGRSEQRSRPAMRQDAVQQRQQQRNQINRGDRRGPQGNTTFNQPTTCCCQCPLAKGINPVKPGQGYGPGPMSGHGFRGDGPRGPQAGFRGQGYGPGPMSGQGFQGDRPRGPQAGFRGQGYGPGPMSGQGFQGERSRANQPNVERPFALMGERILNALETRHPDLAAEAKERIEAGERPLVVLDNVLDKLAGSGTDQDREFANRVRERMETMPQNRQPSMERRMGNQPQTDRPQMRQQRRERVLEDTERPLNENQMRRMGEGFLRMLEQHKPELAEQARVRIEQGNPPHDVLVNTLERLSNSESAEDRAFAERIQSRIDQMHERVINQSEQVEGRPGRMNTMMRQERRAVNARQGFNPERLEQETDRIDQQIKMMENRLQELKRLQEQFSEEVIQEEVEEKVQIEEEIEIEIQETNELVNEESAEEN